jgi:hypothetical protein
MRIEPSKPNRRQTQKLYYPRATHPDIALEEKPLVMQNNYNANNIYEWNIDGCSEYNIMSKLHQMTMVATAYKTTHNCSDQLTSHVLVAGFTGQLKGWWDTHLSEEDKHKIFQAVCLDSSGEPILRDGQTIPDSTNTLAYTIIKTFIGSPGIFRERSSEILNNLKCKTLSDFRWYKDSFLSRIYERPDGKKSF